jgi:hypothetical protein
MLARCAHTARPMCRARTTHHSIMACERIGGAKKGVADCAPNGACEHPSVLTGLGVLEALLLSSREHRAKDRQARAWVQTKQPRRARGRSSSVMGMEIALRALGLRDDTYDQPEKATPVEPDSAPAVATAVATAATEVTYPTSTKGLGSPLTHLHWDSAQSSHIRTGAGLAPVQARTGTGLTPCHICTRTRLRLLRLLRTQACA